MLKWRKQTSERAASLGMSLLLVNLGQLYEGGKDGRKHNEAGQQNGKG